MSRAAVAAALLAVAMVLGTVTVAGAGAGWYLMMPDAQLMDGTSVKRGVSVAQYRQLMVFDTAGECRKFSLEEWSRRRAKSVAAKAEAQRLFDALPEELALRIAKAANARDTVALQALEASAPEVTAAVHESVMADSAFNRTQASVCIASDDPRLRP